MGMARKAFDAAKHPRGAHGHFAYVSSSRGGESGIRERLAAGYRSPSAFQPAKSGAARRDLKKRVQVGTEVARGARRPANTGERLDLEYASPTKRAAQKRLTGDYVRPRSENIRMAKLKAQGFGSPKPLETVAVRRTFTGQARRIRDYTPPAGVKPTTRGLAALLMHRPDDTRLPQKVKKAAPRVDKFRAGVEKQVAGVRGGIELRALADKHGVSYTPTTPAAELRRRIIDKLAPAGG